MSKVICSKLKEYVKTGLIGTRHEWESHIDNIFRIFEQNLSTFTPENILDIGCGDGQRTIRIAKYYNVNMSNIYGLDYDSDLIRTCETLFNANKIDLETDDILHKDNYFDLVVCNQVLEHLKNYKKTTDEAIRVTKNGGYIVIGIPNLAHLINRIYLLFGIQPMCIDLNGPHVRSFTHKNFVKILNSLESIKLIDCKGSLMYPLPFFLGKSLASHFVGLSGYICYLLQKI
jgi:ubiquinone/menaquinone biosynthesis C-methylase UbiE